jgi:NAD(P)-dependent dehydrogenase (short-subunit alcohol dehydrogenase family)
MRSGMRAKDRVAVVTGAASGIGKAIALKFAHAGVHVAIMDINEELARRVADEIRGLAMLLKKGYIFRGLKPVNWCFDCGSALAEAEVEYEDRKDPAVDVGFEFAESEKLAAARIAERERSRKNSTDSTDRTDPTAPPAKAPDCPLCRKPMALSTARKGSQAGSQFWGCSAYPDCKGSRPQNS